MFRSSTMAMTTRSALFWGRRFSGGPLTDSDSATAAMVGSLPRSGRPSPNFSTVLYNWTATLNDPYQHDDKRQHKKKMDKAA